MPLSGKASLERPSEIRSVVDRIFGRDAPRVMDIANRFAQACKKLGGLPYARWRTGKKPELDLVCEVPKALARATRVSQIVAGSNLPARFRIKGMSMVEVSGVARLDLSIAAVSASGYEVRHASLDIPALYIDEVEVSARKVGSLRVFKRENEVRVSTGGVLYDVDSIELRVEPRPSSPEKGLRIVLEV